MARAIACIIASLTLGLGLGCGNGDSGNGGQPAACLDGVEVPDVSGDWFVHELTLAASDCSDVVEDILQDAIQETDECVFAVSQASAEVTAIDCGDNTWEGCIDEGGTVTIGSTRQESEAGCTVRLDADINANLTASPISGTLTLNVDLSGTCAFTSDCSAVVNATATRVEPAPAAQRGTALPAAALRSLLRAGSASAS